MSKDAKSAQSNTTSTPSKKSFGKHNNNQHGKGGGGGSADKRPDNSKERKGSARSRQKPMKEHHHQKDKDKEHLHHHHPPPQKKAGKKDEKKESEKEKKHPAGEQGSLKHLKKEKKEQNSLLPTEFEEVKAARRPAISKTKRKHLVVEEDAAPGGTPIVTASQTLVPATTPESLPAVEEGIPALQSNDSKGSGDPDSSGRIPGELPDNDAIPGIKLSKELIKHGSKENAKNNGSNKEKQQTKLGSKEIVKSETFLPKTVIAGTPGLMQTLPMLPQENDVIEKKDKIN